MTFGTYFMLALTTFLPMVDPFGNMTIFSSLMEGLPSVAVRKVALKSCFFAFLAIVFFGFFGNKILEMFHIQIHSLKIVGGIIFFIMGYDMLQAKMSRTKVSNKIRRSYEEEKDELNDMAFTPLAIPLLCGPGAITNAIILMNKTQGAMPLKLAFVLGTLAIMLITLFCFLGIERIAKLLGPVFNRIMLRLMGLLLMVIAVESFFSGITPMIQKILNAQ